MYIAAIEDMRRIELDLKNSVDNIHSLAVGDLSVSGAAFISSFIPPKIIMAFSKKYPGIQIQLLESNMAVAGMGITFTTDTVIGAAGGNEELLFYKLDSLYSERVLYIAHKKKQYISPAVAEFIRMAKDIYSA